MPTYTADQVPASRRVGACGVRTCPTKSNTSMPRIAAIVIAQIQKGTSMGSSGVAGKCQLRRSLPPTVGGRPAAPEVMGPRTDGVAAWGYSPPATRPGTGVRDAAPGRFTGENAPGAADVPRRSAGCRTAALRQRGDHRVVGDVDQLPHLVVGHRAGPVDRVPAVPPDVGADGDRARVAVAPLPRLRGVPAALQSDGAAVQPDEREGLAADLGHELGLTPRVGLLGPRLGQAVGHQLVTLHESPLHTSDPAPAPLQGPAASLRVAGGKGVLSQACAASSWRSS